ncbi:hypothetical protein CTI12_AA630390 [Artemisia annua]|uniref:Uncharacterized protein n=1 Tax=Artemisia annua TaxID=35608 RepID=A0A2U1K904_ARTAN|nr:hypothetical protein CTI12_AA630390 [Artemisia annua]
MTAITFLTITLIYSPPDHYCLRPPTYDQLPRDTAVDHLMMVVPPPIPSLRPHPYIATILYSTTLSPITDYYHPTTHHHPEIPPEMCFHLSKRRTNATKEKKHGTAAINRLVAQDRYHSGWLLWLNMKPIATVATGGEGQWNGN